LQNIGGDARIIIKQIITEIDFDSVTWTEMFENKMEYNREKKKL
jgi:hypothetical protein